MKSLSVAEAIRVVIASRGFFALYEDDFDFWSSIFTRSGLSVTERDSHIRGGERQASLLRKDISLSEKSIRKLTKALHSAKFELIAGLPECFTSGENLYDAAERFNLQGTTLFVKVNKYWQKIDVEAEIFEMGKTFRHAFAIDLLNFGRGETQCNPQLAHFGDIGVDLASPVGQNVVSLAPIGPQDELIQTPFYRVCGSSGALEEFELSDSVWKVLQRKPEGGKFTAEHVRDQGRSPSLLQTKITPYVVVHSGTSQNASLWIVLFLIHDLMKVLVGWTSA